MILFTIGFSACPNSYLWNRGWKVCRWHFKRKPFDNFIKLFGLYIIKYKK